MKVVWQNIKNVAKNVGKQVREEHTECQKMERMLFVNQIEEDEKINNIFDVIYINKKSFNIWSAIKQSEDNSEENRIPLLVFSRNRSKTYAVIEWEKLLELIKNKNSLTEIEMVL